jgi:murein DD-endopeptidase MepM/ murein hydrolase activator NlpD
MVWNIEIRRAAVLLTTVLFASVFLAGCVDDSPRTHLDWIPQNDIAPVTRTADVAPHRIATHRASAQNASVDCPVPRSKPAWYTASALPPLSTPTVQPASTYGAAPVFAWPAIGPVISDFGTNAAGQRNDGINIATPVGTPIRAAAAGTISYAGNELRGYGNLILIKHDDGYVTAYAHAERILVTRGEMVVKGQVIAYAGDTGDVSSPQLHFEIRRGVQPVNPRTLLLASRAS